MKKIFVIISCVCLLSQMALAQLSTDVKPKSIHQLKKQLYQLPANINFTQQIQALTPASKNYQFSNANQQIHQPQPLAYAYKDLAFFCKIEVQLEKSVKLPVKFRLGSVDYVDYLEGKRQGY